MAQTLNEFNKNESEMSIVLKQPESANIGQVQTFL
jgi:hypothetical protein